MTFDAVGKDMVEFGPAGWVAFLGRPRPDELVRLIDADLSATVSTATDKIIRVDDPEPWLLMIELQANWDGDLPFDVMRRYALVRHRHRLPTACVIVLLRPSANTSAMTGTFAQPDPLGGGWAFPFQVVRVWEYPPETFLTGPLSLLPLAVIAAVDPGTVEGVISEVEARLSREASRSRGGDLLEATFQLLALRFDNAFIQQMRDQMAEQNLARVNYLNLFKGDAVRAMIVRQGTKKFGPPTPEVTGKLKAEEDLDALNDLSERLLDVATWDDLLAGAP